MKADVLVIPPWESGFRRELLTGIGQYASIHGPWGFWTTSGHGWAIPTVPSLADWRGDGVILPITSAKALAEARSLGVPFVNTTAWPGVPTVTNDNARIGQVGAEHLLAEGYQKLAFVTRSRSIFSAQRMEAFTACAREHGIGVATYCCDLDASPDSYWRETDPALRSWLESLPRPVGIMCSNDVMARQVLEAATALGLNVPGQLGVLGADNDTELCDMSFPSISSIRLNGERLGFEAAEMLDRLMGGAEAADDSPTVIPPTGVCKRQSTDALLHLDQVVAAARTFMIHHANVAISVDDVADAVFVSRATLERRFRDALGHTPFEELRNRQIEHVKGLLLEKDWKIERIAQASAFRDARSLSKAFRKATGTLPSVFRRRRGDDR